MHPSPERHGTVLTPSAQSILDALAVSVAVLDQAGTIIAVNEAWKSSGQANQAGEAVGVGSDYLGVCGSAFGGDAPSARATEAGIRSVLSGGSGFSLEYPCHSPDRPRWFQVHVSSLEHEGAIYAVVAHYDITERILVEQERQALLARSQRHAVQIGSLATACVTIAKAHSSEAILQETADQARAIVGAQLAAVHGIPRGGGDLVAGAVSLSDHYAHFASFTVPPTGAGIYSHVMDSGHPVRLTEGELHRHPSWRDYGGYKAEHPPLRGLLAAPLTREDGSTMGVLMLSDKEAGEFTPEDEAIVIQLAQIASVSLEKAARIKAHKESEGRLQAIREHANIGIGETDRSGRFLFVNNGLCALTGYSRDELLRSSISDLTYSDDIGAERALYEQHVAGGLKTYSLEKRYIRKDGSIAWMALSATAMFDEEGGFRYSLRVLQDINARKLQEERQHLLIRELHHRVRNTLATVQGILGATVRSNNTVQEFYRSFSARIGSLARTHALLTEDYWQTASLQDMLGNELLPFMDEKRRRVVLQGPPVHLAADLAIPVGMALHELTINAAKHGALSVPGGHVTVAWSIIAPEGARKLQLEWTEYGGPPVEEPKHAGFSQTLLQRALPAQCDANVEVHYDRDGFRFRMTAPLIERRLVPPY